MDTEKEYVKAKIEGIFDLDEFSKQFNMTPKEVITFHNKYCGIQDLLTMTLPKYVEYVYLPPQNFLERDLKLLKSTKLSLPHISGEKTYGVMLNFLPKDLNMHYKINVQRTTGFLEIKKEKTYVNNQEIDQTVAQMFEKAEQALFPLQISQNAEGGIIKITNHEEIAKRWKTDCRPKLADYYKSETSDQILSKIDSAFKNVDAKRQLLERNLFYKLFFLPVYQSYPQFYKSGSVDFYFSSLGQSVNYDFEFFLNKEFTRGEKIALQLLGKEEENIFNKNREKGEIDLLYKLHKETHEIFSITGSVSAFENDVEYKTNFELYELKNS